MNSEKCSFIAHDRGRYPMSRDHDLPNFSCKQISCIVNFGEKCMSPTLCVIGENGKCEGYIKKDKE